jgi:hypothetical protein
MNPLKILLCVIFIFIGAASSSAETINTKELDFQFFIHPIAGPEEALIELFLINEGSRKLEFEAPTSQWYEITITNEKNEVVYQYSKGRSFLQAFQKLTIKPGEKKRWIENIYDKTNQKLSTGTYNVQARLKAVTVNGEDISNYHSLTDEASMVIPEPNPIIEMVKVEKSGNHLLVSGKARPVSGNLFYVVEDGHHEWIPETKINVDFKTAAWTSFSFEIKMPLVQENAAESFILYIYEKDKQGVIKHSYPKLLKSAY